MHVRERNGSSLHLLIGALAGTLAPLTVFAADPAPPTPGSISDTLKRPPELQAPAAPSISAPPARPAVPAEQGPTIAVTRFEFTGNTIYDRDTLAGLVQDYVDRRITLGELYQAADRVADYYYGHGYLLASVNVPAQTISDGVVRLEVIEGRIGKRVYEGNKSYSKDGLDRYLSHVQPGQVYTSAPLERDLQTLNALPGLAARAVLKPGEEYGTSDVTVKIKEKRIEGAAFIDNFGRHDVGEFRYSASLAVNNVFGLGDRLQLLGLHSNTNRLNYGYGAWSMPMNTAGLRFNADVGYAEFKVADPFKVTGRNRNVDANLEQAWVRTLNDTFITTAGVTHTNANADLSGRPFKDTNVTVLNAGGTYTHVWPDAAVTQYVASLHSSFHKAGPVDPASAEGVDHERVRFELNGQHLQPLPWWRLQALINVDAVYSPDPLPDTEQVSIGGPTSVRGFEPSELRGDRGFFAQLSLRRPFTLGPVLLAPRVFGDTGEVTLLNPNPGTAKLGFGEVLTKDSISSAGAGFDLAYRTLSFKLDWAYPLDSRSLIADGRDGGRVYGLLSASF
jgi:hemolysin activation/secretion protein